MIEEKKANIVLEIKKTFKFTFIRQHLGQK